MLTRGNPVTTTSADVGTMQYRELAADTNFVLHDDPAVLNLARQIVRQRLGVDDGGNAGES